MYSTKPFKSLYELTNFLNEHNIKKENIIKITVREDTYFYPYILIYCK